MQRITLSHLEAAVARLNEATGSAAKPYTQTADDKCVANVGNWHIGSWHISGGYGVALQRVVNEHGAVRSYGGYGTKRELLSCVYAMLDGIGAVQ